MKPKYIPQEFEKKWIDVWEKEQIYATPDIEKELTEDISVSDLLRKTQKHARVYYFDVLRKWDGYVEKIGKKINISRIGWDHTYKLDRPKKEKLFRYFAVTKVQDILLDDKTIVRHVNGRNNHCEFWECTGIVDGVQIQVIVRSIMGNTPHLYSIIWQGRVKDNTIKKELSRALKRHAQGMVTLQLHNHYATFVRECQAHRKQYILDMFPYPSGAGLHVGHVEGYTATDIYSRYMRMNGKDVLHPMGWDAFGLPAENYAIKTGVHPKKSTDESIKNFITQIKRAGLSYDWKREIGSHREDYYKWTQWLFLLLYKKGLAYRKEASVNWCESCKTVLANEQVVGGLCERCDTVVIQKKMRQWFFKITDYAERLLTDLEKLDWPESTKAGQRNWIGKSEGALIKFEIRNMQEQIIKSSKHQMIKTIRNHRITKSSNHQNKEISGVEVFTTRHDTVFGATFLVLAPDHPLVDQITTADQKKKVEEYVATTKQKTELQRQQDEKEKTGLFTGAYAINPFTKEEIPIWIADYVLMSYGTGAIMAVPAHDERDFAFAKKYGLEIRPVVAPVINADQNLHSPQKTEKLRTVLHDICKTSNAKKKQICLWGGWAVEILVGHSYRDHEDIDVHIRKVDIEWWKETMRKKGFTIEKYPPEEEANEAFTFVAKKDDTVVDFEAIDVDDSNYVIWLDEEKSRSSEKTFDEMYELREFDGIPVHTMRKETVKWWFMTEEGKSSQRWKDIYDLLMLGLQSYKGDGRIINSDFIVDHSPSKDPISAMQKKIRKWYKKAIEGKSVFAGCLEEKVSFTKSLWEHMMEEKPRTNIELVYRMKAIEYAEYILRYGSLDNTKQRKAADNIYDLWTIHGVYEGVWIKVVIRSINKGGKHIYSIIWRGKEEEVRVKNALKKGAVLRLSPRPHESGKTLSSSTFNTTHYSILRKYLSSLTVNGVSFSLNSLDTKVAKEKVIEYLEKNNIGRRKVTYKLRDWLISRQRFWGAPIPIVYKKNDYDHVLLEFFREVRTIAKKYFFSYLKGQKKYISNLKDHVSITYVSWEHIAMKTRSKEDTLYRLFFLPYILEMLQSEDIDIRYAKGKKDNSEFWECTVVIFDIRFQVILRSYNKGKKHLYSLIYKGEVKKPKKMELSRACIPRSWGIYTPQLQNYFTLFINKCQEGIITPGKHKKSTVSCLYPQCQASLEQVKIAFRAYSKYIEKVTDKQDTEGAHDEIPIPVREQDLPIVLPMDAEFKPTGQSPLTDNTHFQQVDKKKYPGAVRREADTMDTFVDSSWYFLRFCDPHNTKEFASKKAMNTWGPVDLYMGGAEHTVLHLLYARFFTKVLYDEGYLTFDEPFLKLRHQGIILGPDHRKMSKRWGNVINPLDVCDEYGADTLRMYEMFMGPIDAMKPWNVKSVQGPYRFLTRVWKLYRRYASQCVCKVDTHRNASVQNAKLLKKEKPEVETSVRDADFNPSVQNACKETHRNASVLLHKTIKKVSEDILDLKFNTAIAAMMEFVNHWEKAELRDDKVIEKEEITTRIIQRETLNEADRLGRDFYFEVMRKWNGYVPSLGENIYITRSGWQHLFEMQRSPADKLYRYFVLPKIIPLLECKEAKPKYKKVVKDHYEFWEYTGIVEDVLVQVILRSVRGGKKHLYSVIWKGEVSEDKKKELSIACIPRVQGNYSLQLHNYYRTYVEKSQITQHNTKRTSVISIPDARMFLQILAPFAPFMTEEIWRNGFGEKQSIHVSQWPLYDKSLIIEETINLPVQINGKMRGSLSITTEEAEDQDALVQKARADKKIGAYITKGIRRVVYVKGRILNIVV